MSHAPIGIMDSGFGGLSVWQEVRKLLPKENLLYFADSGFCPYGSRPEEEVFDLTHRIVRFFIQQKCKMVVMACNTATAVAIERLRRMYEIPFVGMEPAIKPASEDTQSGIIGILATENTFRGKHFHRTRDAYAGNHKLIVQPGHGLVELVENGLLEGGEAHDRLLPLIKPMIEEGVDQLVLGCSHYPFLSKEIEKMVGQKITVIDPSPAVARQIFRLLEKDQSFNLAESRGNYFFFSTGNLFALKKFIENNLEGQDAFAKNLEKYWA